MKKSFKQSDIVINSLKILAFVVSFPEQLSTIYVEVMLKYCLSFDPLLHLSCSNNYVSTW